MRSFSIVAFLLIFIVLGVSAGSAPTVAAPAKTDTLNTALLRQQIAELRQLRDYELEIVMTVKVTGVTMDITLNHRALAPDYCFSEIMLPGIGGRTILCDGDSLWTLTPGFQTYYSEPWTAVPVQGNGDDPFASLKGKSVPFEFLALIMGQGMERRFTWEGTETLVLNGEPTECAVWRSVPGSAEEDEVTLWLDTGTTLMRKQHTAIMRTPGSPSSVTIELPVLKTNMGLTPADFQFTPPDGYHRVSGPEQKFVANLMEGQNPGLVNLQDLAGNAVSSDSWRGRVVVLDFWATWCGPCLKSLPHLQDLAGEYGDEILIVGVTNEDPATVKGFFGDAPSPYPILIDADETATEKYGVKSLPTLFVLDQEGTIRTHLVGYQEKGIVRSAIERARGQ